MDGVTKDRIAEYLTEHDGVIRTTEFQQAGFHNSYLSELTEEGRLVRLKAGLYIAAEIQTVSGFYEIQLALPPAVVCLASALGYYDLSTYEPPAVHVAIPRDDRILPPEFPPTRRFSFGKTRYQLGITQEQIEGPVKMHLRLMT